MLVGSCRVCVPGGVFAEGKEESGGRLRAGHLAGTIPWGLP
jgi:hypothetical protein